MPPSMSNANNQKLDAENQPLSHPSPVVFVNTDANMVHSSFEILRLLVFSNVTGCVCLYSLLILLRDSQSILWNGRKTGE